LRAYGGLTGPQAGDTIFASGVALLTVDELPRGASRVGMLLGSNGVGSVDVDAAGLVLAEVCSPSDPFGPQCSPDCQAFVQ